MKRSRYKLAMHLLRCAAELYPHALILRVSLARVALAMGDDSAARLALSPDQLARGPDANAYYHRIARLYIELEDPVVAQHYLDLAKQANTKSPVVWRLYGAVLRMQGKVDAAVDALQLCAKLEPTRSLQIKALANVATVLADAGKGGAETIYRNIIDIDPHNTHAYYGLVDCDRSLRGADAVVQTIRSMAASDKIGTSSKYHLHHALGLVYDREGDYGRAFAHLMIANRIRTANAPPFDMTARQRDADQRCAVFESGLVGRLSQYGCPEDVLTCIVGMPRSGTTLTEQMLGSHSEIVALGERNDFWRLSSTMPRLLGTKTAYPQCCKELSGDHIARIWPMILDRMRRLAGPCQKIVTKLPADFANLGIIKILFPKTKIIHCRRHPLDTCLSCFQQNFNSVAYARDIFDLTSAYKVYRRLMEHWNDVLPASTILDLAYESLVQEPERAIRNILDFIGLEFEDSCLTFYLGSRSVQTASRWQVRQPIYQSSVSRSDPYREFLGPLLELEVDD